MDKKAFVATYSSYLEKGSGGLFIGAGLSMQAGYPSWLTLVSDMAQEMGLDVSKESDLPGVVQFFLNKANKTRTTLSRTINTHFGQQKDIPRIYRILDRLPLRYIWTSNYDTLIERAWLTQRKLLDVKSQDKDVATENPWAHAVLYKMHGTVDHPSQVVIAKGDYESYRRERAGFLHLLTGHVISRHMLFLGLSFTDPNLNHILTIVREAFDNNPPEHFTIVKRPKKESKETKKHFEYVTRRHELWINDLQNYGIQCVAVDEYQEIDSLLEAVERRLAMKSVMISGSYPDRHVDGDADERRKIERVAQGVGRVLAKHNFRFVSGFGLVVGSAALSGALEEFNKQETPNFEQSLYLRPFPQLIPTGVDRQEYYNRYREDLCIKAGVCVFISGKKLDLSGNFVETAGVINEFKVVVASRRYPLPVGATGGAANKIWQMVSDDYHHYFGEMPRSRFDALNANNVEAGDLVDAVEWVLNWLIDNDPYSS